MKHSFRLSSYFAFLLGFLNTISVLIILWSCYRGIDMSDESYYYLGYLYSGNQPDLGASSFHIVYERLFSYFNFTLPQVRLLRLVLTILAVIPLFLGIKKVTQLKSKTEQAILFHLLLGGMLLTYSFLPLALSYNSMSSVLITMICGFWLLVFTDSHRPARIFNAILVGLLTTLLFFVKITNVMLLPILVAATLYWLYRKKRLHSIRIGVLSIHAAAFGLGALISLVVVSGGVASIPETIMDYWTGSFGTLNTDPFHTLTYIKKRYTDNAEMLLGKIKYPLLVLVALFLLIKLLLVTSRIKRRILKIVFILLGIATVLVVIIKFDYWKGGTGSVYVMIIGFLLLSVLVMFTRFLEKKKIDFLLLLLAMGIPLVGAAGTNNGLSGQVMLYAVFMSCTIYFLVRDIRLTWYKYIVIATVLLLGSSQVITATVSYPYRQAPLTKSVNQISGIQNLKNLKVAPGVIHLRNELAFLQDMPTPYIFAYSAQRGMALLVNKKPYSLEWFHPNMTGKMCQVIKKSTIDPNDILFLIPQEMPLDEKVIECLKAKGILFKENYELSKAIEFHDYKSKKDLLLHVYLPIEEKKKDH